MKKLSIFAASTVGVLVVGSTAVLAHGSIVPHAHPHLRAADGALLGFDTLALVAIALFPLVGAGLVLAQARRKK